MSIVSYVFCVINIFLGLASIFPCIMGAAMGADSPQAQNDPWAIVLCYVFLTFPIVCFICGILPPIMHYFKMPVLVLLFGLWPWIQAVSVIGFMWFNEPS